MDNLDIVLKALTKPGHFTDAWALVWEDQTHIKCQIPIHFDGTGIITIIFSTAYIDKANPYDIVNSVWEYIAKNVL